MIIVVVTYIDKITGISVQIAPAINGPVLPSIKGLSVLWARTSAYPTEVPEFVCTVDDDANIAIAGVISVLSPEEEQIQFSQEIDLRARQAFEQKANPIRTQRNRLLMESDIYLIPDFPISDLKREEWKAYRQQLRDVTLQTTFPDSVIWPEIGEQNGA